MENLADTQSASQPAFRPPPTEGQTWLKRIIAGNPFYLLSAGFLLYGINQLTTDPRLVGAEFSMLRFNFCALVIYEIMLVTTAIALSRRGIWYDALLLVGLANLFVIVPFSLISRAVFLNPGLALLMCASGTLLAVGKFWALKRYMPALNLPRRLLAFGAVLLIANAAAPLIFKAIANNPAQITVWLNAIWTIVLPVFAGLANLLPKPVDLGDAPGQRRWLPLACYLGWILVTLCHLGGLGYSISFDWNLSLLVPLIWVATWTLYFRRRDFVRNPSKMLEQACLFIPLLVPLLAGDGKWTLPILATLNFACYVLRFVLKDRSRLALIQVLGAAAILLGGLPAAWLDRTAPGMSRAEWMFSCALLCFFWLIFLSRDPRVALVAVLSVLALCFVAANEFIRLVIQIGLVSLLAHSLRWDDRLWNGARILRNLAGVLWVLLSASWLRESAHDARLPVYIGASVLLILYGVYAVFYHAWKPRAIPVFSVAVLVSEPGFRFAGELTNAPPGFLAIAASFLLFALGSLAAFSKSKREGPSGKLAPLP